MRLVEIGLGASARMLHVIEPQHMTMLALADRGRIVKGNVLRIAVEIGDGNDEFQLMRNGKQRSAGIGVFFLHGEAGIEQHRRHDLAGEGRLEPRSEEHTSELQSLMRISYAVFCLKKKKLQQ